MIKRSKDKIDMSSNYRTYFIEYFKKNETVFALIATTLPVFIFNIYPALGLDVLLLDDNARYHAMANDTYSFAGRSFLSPYIKYIGHAIMFNSTQLARVYYVIMYMLPLSFFFYYFNRNCLKLPFFVSYGAAVIMNILPNQKYIPVFIDGASVLFGMIFILTSFICCMKYLEDNKPLRYIIFSAVLWFYSNNTMGERAIFLLPAALVLIFFAKSTLSRKALASTIFLSISSLRLYFYFFGKTMVAAGQPVDLIFGDKIHRFLKSIWWWLPITPPSEHLKYYAILIFIILIIGLVISATRHKRDYRPVMVYLFYFAWFFLSGFPFWWMSRYFSARYFYISHMGLTLLMILSCYVGIRYLLKNREAIIYCLLAATIFYYGISKNIIFSKMASERNKQNKKIVEIMKDEQVTENLQIAFVGFKTGTGSYYIWSSGYLEHSLKMNHLSGIIGVNYNFYNPFNKEHRGYSFKMSGLDVEKPLIAYRRNNVDYKFTRMRFFLQWETMGTVDSEWTLYKTNDTNKLEIIGSGDGLESYRKIIQAKNIRHKDILWGDLSDGKAINSLH